MNILFLPHLSDCFYPSIKENMIKTDIIRAAWLSNLIGPTRTLTRIIKNKDYFLRRGYDVEVYTMDCFSKREFSNKVSVNPVKSFIRKLASRSCFVCRMLIEHTFMRYGKQISDYYTDLKRTSDIIVFHDLFSCWFYLKNNPRPQAKTVVFYHNSGAAFDSMLFYYPCLKGSRYLDDLLKMEQFILSRIDKVVFIAEYGRRNFLKIHPDFDIAKTSFFHNGIDDLPDDGKNDGKDRSSLPFKYRLCCVGTLNERKGQRTIIEALNQISTTKRADIHVSFVGGGELGKDLEEMCRSMGLSAHVSFEGAIDNSRVDDYLRQANIFILMSYEEGLPISIIEAMRTKLPVIASRVGGIPEQVMEGENGFLLEPDAKSLAALLQHLDDYDWEAMGRRSRELFLQKFTFGKMMGNYCNMLDSLYL